MERSDEREVEIQCHSHSLGEKRKKGVLKSVKKNMICIKSKSQKESKKKNPKSKKKKRIINHNDKIIKYKKLTKRKNQIIPHRSSKAYNEAKSNHTTIKQLVILVHL